MPKIKNDESSAASNLAAINEFDLKHRITGAAVLLFFGALVLPWLLGPPSEASKSEQRVQASVASTVQPVRITTEQTPAVESNLDDVEETVYISKITPLDARGNSDIIEAADRAANRGSSKLPASESTANAPPKKQSTATADAETATDQLIKAVATEQSSDQKTDVAVVKTQSQAAGSQTNNKQLSQPSRQQREQALQAAVADEARKLAAAKPSSKVDVGWVVQVGLFTEKSRALALISDLKLKGFEASSSVVDTNRGKNTGTRVWLGPFAKRAEASNEQNRLKTNAGKDGFIRVYP